MRQKRSQELLKSILSHWNRWLNMIRRPGPGRAGRGLASPEPAPAGAGRVLHLATSWARARVTVMSPEQPRMAWQELATRRTAYESAATSLANRLAHLEERGDVVPDELAGQMLAQFITAREAYLGDLYKSLTDS